MTFVRAYCLTSLILIGVLTVPFIIVNLFN